MGRILNTKQMADKAGIIKVQFWRFEFIVEIENQDEENSLIFCGPVACPLFMNYNMVNDEPFYEVEI